MEEFLKLSSPSAQAPQGQAAAGSDRIALRDQLRQWLERPEVREALWIASPELVQALTTWRDDPESAKGRKLEQALYRYLARMTARSTPFGAFAGCSTGEVGDATRLELSPRSQYHRSSRLDMEYLYSLAAHLLSDPALRGNLRFRCNTTLHLAAGKYHHVRTDWQQGDRVFQLVATDPTPQIDATLSRAASGARAGELAIALVASDREITQDEANQFVGRLVESQLLVADLVPPVTGAEPVLYMAEQLEQARATGLATELRAVAEHLRALDRGGLGADPAAYDRIVGAVSRLGGEFRPGRLVQLDLFKPVVAATLDSRLVDDLLDAIQVLHAIRDNSSPPPFQQFKEEFHERYQDREVPLLEALDDEAGIGFENEDNPTAEPLIAAIDFRPREETPAGEVQKRQLVLERRVEELRDKNEIVLALDPGLLDELKVASPLPLPDAFSLMGTAFRLPDGQPGFYGHTIFGPSGANLLARFRHADQRLAENVQAHIKAEEALHSGNAVFAEIVYLPEGRVGNVICRPVLRQYEIPLLATSGVPVDRQIALSDLTVSLRQGRVVLRSRRLAVEVLPRLTSAHNYGSPRSLKLYKFLCLLQAQDKCSDLFWDWGAAGKAAFLPRVTLGNIVFSLACWRINKETALELSSGRTSVSQWRQSTMVPRFAFIAEYDNQLLIDFENSLAVETFLEHIRKQTETVMVEMFPPPDALTVRGPEGAFVHEMVVPFVRRTPRPPAIELAKPAAATSKEAAASPEAISERESPAPAQTDFVPGSDWLFAKLYCSPSHADRLLQELVKPLVAQVMASGWARRWFFLRYGDPQWHLRLRFQADPALLSERVFPLLNRLAEEQQRQGTLWRLHFEAYEPETERYGGPQAISLAEHLFQLDSELCLGLLHLTSADPDLRWQLAGCAVDCLLSALGFTLEEKEALTKSLARDREQTLVVDQDYKQQLAQAFRTHRQTLSAILAEANAAAAGSRVIAPSAMLPAEAIAALVRYSAALRPLRQQLEALRQSGQLTQTLPDLASSFAHMHLNRAFRYRHHEQEAVVCDLLSRVYASRIARKTEKP